MPMRAADNEVVAADGDITGDDSEDPVKTETSSPDTVNGPGDGIVIGIMTRWSSEDRAWPRAESSILS